MTRGKRALVCACVLAAMGGSSLAAMAGSASAQVIHNYTHGGCCGLLWHEDVPIRRIEHWPWELAATWHGKGYLTAGNMYTGVEAGGVACNSSGEPAGVVVSNPTSVEVGFINAKKKEVGIEERPTEGSVYAQFTCGGTTMELTGGPVGLLTKDSALKGSLTYTFSPVYKGLEGGSEESMQLSVDGGPPTSADYEDVGVMTPEEGTLKLKASKKTGVELITKEKKKKK